MKIDALDAVMNSPLRAYTAEEQSKIQKDLSLLIRNPTLDKVWIDGSGHLHQKVCVVNLLTLLQAVIDRIFQAVSGVKLGVIEKDEFISLKSKEILDQYVPLLLQQELQFSSADPEKIVRLQSLFTQLGALEEKIGGHSAIFLKRKGELSHLLDGLVAECHFDQIVKTAQIGSTQFDEKSVHQKFYQLSPLHLQPIHFTKNHIEMIRRVVITAPDLMKDDLSAHAARHFCALQKGDSDRKLSVSLECAQASLHRDDLIIAAKEFKVIPLCLQNNAEALASILAGLIGGDTIFAKEVASRLDAVLGGKEQIEQMIEKEGRHLNNPELQGKYIQRILFLEQIYPYSAKLDALFQDLEYLAIYGDLPSTCVQQLIPRGRIMAQLYATLDRAQQMNSQEKIKAMKELLPIAINLFTKSSDLQVAHFIDEIILKLFESGLVEDPGAVITSALADAFASENRMQSEKLISSVLTVYTATGNEVSGQFFRKIFQSLLDVEHGVDILQKVIQGQVDALPHNLLAMSSLSLVQKEIGQALASDFGGARLETIGTQISAVLKNHAQKLAKENLEGKFKKHFNELLSFDTGLGDLEQLIQTKVDVLRQAQKSIENRSAAQAYLQIFHAQIVTQLKSSPTVQLTQLKEVIEQAMENAKLSLVNPLKKPCLTQTIIKDLEIKVLSQNLDRRLYNQDGAIAQSAFLRPAQM